MATNSGVRKRRSGRNVTRVTASGLDALIGLLGSDEEAIQTANTPPACVEPTPTIKQEPSDSDDTEINFPDGGYEDVVNVKQETADLEDIKADIFMSEPDDRKEIRQEPLDSEDNKSIVAMTDNGPEYIKQESRTSIDTAHDPLPTKFEAADRLKVPDRADSTPGPDDNVHSTTEGTGGLSKECSREIREYNRSRIRKMANRTHKAMQKSKFGGEMSRKVMEARLDERGIEMYRKELEARLSEPTSSEPPVRRISDTRIRKWAAKASNRSEKDEQILSVILAANLSSDEMKLYQELAEKARAEHEAETHDVRLRRRLEALPASQTYGDTSRFIKRFVEEHRDRISDSFRAWADKTMTSEEQDEYNKQTLMILGTSQRKHRMLDGGRQTFL